MIFYFTGTGNSRWAAEALSKALGEPTIVIADELAKSQATLTYPVGRDEKVLFVYPIHSWGPAIPVRQFISRLVLEDYTCQPVYSVCTCGDDCGRTDKKMRSDLRKRGITLTGSYSVQMPNNYILMPGFDVDSKEAEAAKLQAAPARVDAIVEAIRKQNNIKLYHAGSLPALKSYLVYPLFANFAIQRNAFYATDACISCGLCEQVCPMGTISMAADGKPRWGNSCVQCVACIHRCPVRAIEYGTVTLKKGRYHHPELRNNK